MNRGLQTLIDRGFVKDCTDFDGLSDLMDKGPVTFYCGVDPTGPSLHVGHIVPFFAMHHLQMAGNNPIALVGGGTGLIGDPSGKTEMRKILSEDTIRSNVGNIMKQLGKVVDFSENPAPGMGRARMMNNADWLVDLNYIKFLRDVGVYFSVNRMLTAECFKQRLERGLSFLEFNYMLMQAYDFLVLFRKYGCALELGGDDQWSNILAGANLIRIKEQKPAFAMTFTLLTTSDGKKMGKTAKGAVWLDENKTSPYEFYQYWRNTADEDVEKCMKLLTFLPLDEIAELCRYKDERINRAKEVLAYELTKEVHGEEKADLARSQAQAAFGGSEEDLPVREVKGAATVVDAMVGAGVAKSKGEARRLIEQGGVSVNDGKVTDVNMPVPAKEFVLHKGKKVHVKIVVG